MDTPNAPAPALGSLDRTPGSITNARRWSIVALLFTASLINYFDRATISMALPLISAELHLDPMTKGVLLSAFFWSYALMQIPMGWCSDRWNLRWLYAGSFAVWSIAQWLTGLANSLAALIRFRILLGIGEAIYLPGGSKIVSLLFRRSERGLPCGLFDFGTRTGLVLEGLLVPWMLQHWGWRATFVLIGFTALLWLIPWTIVTPREIRDRSSEQGLQRKGTLRNLLGMLRNRNLLGICLGFVCFDYYWYVLFQWLPDYLVTARQLPISKAGIYSAVVYLVFGLSEPVGGWIADRLIGAGWNEARTRKGIVTFSFLLGLFMIPATRLPNVDAAMVLIIGGALVGLSTANMLVMLQSCAPPEDIGLWTGVYNFVGNLAGISAALLSGFLIKQTGSYSAAFDLGAMLLVTGQLAFWFVLGEFNTQNK